MKDFFSVNSTDENTYEPWKSHVHIRFSYLIRRNVDHSNNILMHVMFVLMLMFLVWINQLNAKLIKRIEINKKKKTLDFTFISSIINHFDVKRLFSCALSSVDNDVDEFNVVELVMIELGWFVDGRSNASWRFCFKR